MEDLDHHLTHGSLSSQVTPNGILTGLAVSAQLTHVLNTYTNHNHSMLAMRSNINTLHYCRIAGQESWTSADLTSTTFQLNKSRYIPLSSAIEFTT